MRLSTGLLVAERARFSNRTLLFRIAAVFVTALAMSQCTRAFKILQAQRATPFSPFTFAI